MIRVSIVIPVYNTEKYLRACLDSVINQTLKDIEILLVDDGSTDSSLEIMREYESKDRDRVHVITKKNGGQASARNLAIPMCKGEYIGFVDSVDRIKPEMYEKLYKMASIEHADYAECGYVNVRVLADGQLEEIPDFGSSRVREYTSVEDMFIDPMVAPWNKLYKRDLLQNSNVIFPEGLIYEDTSFYLKCISFINKFVFCPDKFVIHYDRGGSTMNLKKYGKTADIFAVLKDVIDFYSNQKLSEKFNDELEYEIVKILLCSSMKRISKIPDRKLAAELCHKSFDMINEFFPKYRENKYIKGTGMRNRYMRFVSSRNIVLINNIMSLAGER